MDTSDIPESDKPRIVYLGSPIPKKDVMDYVIDTISILAMLSMIGYAVYHIWTLHRIR